MKFRPERVGKYNSLLRIVVDGNPFENIKVNLEGYSYNEEIVLDRLEFIDKNTIEQKNSTETTRRKKRKNNFKSMNSQSTRNYDFFFILPNKIHI